MTLGRPISAKAYFTNLGRYSIDIEKRRTRRKKVQRKKKRASKGLDFGDTSARFLGCLEDTKLGR